MMRRLFNILGGILGLLVLVGAVIVLYFALNSVKPSETTSNPVQSSSSSPTPVQVESAVTATATRDPGVFRSPLPAPVEPVLPTPAGIIQPPLCQFEGKASPQPEEPSILDKFVFSEPKVIFSREAPIEIIEWLPDNQNLLVHIRNQTKQSIEALDTTTGQTEVYADNLQDANQVHWIATENAVAYTEDKTPEFSGVDQFGLWLSRGKGETPQLLLAAEYDELLRSSGNASKLPPEIARAFNMYDFPFNPELWRYNKYPQDTYYLQSWSEIKFASSVSPDGSKAVFYGVPWLYLVDLKTNQPCEVDLGQTYYVEQGPLRVFNAKWSLDGKLLALQTAVGYAGQNMYYNKLIILNTVTGEIYRPEINWSYILDIEWFPDSRYLVVMGQSTETEQPQLNQPIGIVDSLTQQFRPILSDYTFAQGSQSGFQLALSPNGKNLTVNCPLVSDKYPLGLKGQVCLISIN